ncbi:MAB_1171c family putative transporter [Streptomyces sp. SudanB91_2054]|uniref:MAB_1171c family putative transporter n=1 Tax=Streptomyces sp. SudanB91_2054 TaxID=3035278 RepID=UPI0036DEF556
MAVALIVLLPAALWKMYQLYKAPRDRSLLAVTVCVTCTAISFCLGLPAVRVPVDGVLGPGMAQLVSTVLLLDTAYWLISFYLHSSTDRRRARRRRLREGQLTVLIVVGITWATLNAPREAHGFLYWHANPRPLEVTVLFVVADLYLLYAVGVALRWTSRFARMSVRPTATGLRLTALSLGIMAVAIALRPLNALLSRTDAHPPPGAAQAGTVLLALALPLLAVGLSYPSIITRLTALRLWQHRRNAYRKLRPLWAILHRAFPENALRRSTRSVRREALCVRSVHRRYYRRVIECRDGLVTVSPYLAMLGVGEGASPEAVARVLPTALRACVTDPAGTSPPVGMALPADNGLDADARQLVALSQALAVEH